MSILSEYRLPVSPSIPLAIGNLRYFSIFSLATEPIFMILVLFKGELNYASNGTKIIKIDPVADKKMTKYRKLPMARGSGTLKV